MITPQTFADVITNYLPQPHATLLNGIIFGLPVKQYKVFYEELKVVGLVHIVVLSGMNITLLSTIITNVTSQLGKKISICFTVISIIIFIMFVGPQPPIVRAGFMGVLSLIAILYGRKSFALYSLVLSAVFVAIFWPKWLSGISFQLSYAATLGLVLFNKSIPEKKETASLRSRLKEYISSELQTSLSAQVFTVPLIFYYFKQISFISPVANVMVAWLIGPLMVFGLLAALLGKIHFMLGIIPIMICYPLLSFIIWITHILSLIPFASIQL